MLAIRAQRAFASQRGTARSLYHGKDISIRTIYSLVQNTSFRYYSAIEHNKTIAGLNKLRIQAIHSDSENVYSGSIDTTPLSTRDNQTRADLLSDLNTALENYKESMNKAKLGLTTMDDVDNVTKRAIVRDLAQQIIDAHKVLELLEPALVIPYLSDKESHNIDEMAQTLVDENKDDSTAKGTVEQFMVEKTYNRDIATIVESIIQAYADCSQLSSDMAVSVRLTRGFPQRAQQLLKHLTRQYVVNHAKFADLPQTPFAAVIQAWALSKEAMRGSRADSLFRLKTPTMFRDANAYKWVILALVNSEYERKSAFRATSHLLLWLKLVETSRFKSDGKKAAVSAAIKEPELLVYQSVFRAWVHAEDTLSPFRADRILKRMTEARRKGLITVKPDLTCFRSLFETVANHSDVAELGSLVDRLLFTMQHEYQLVPDTECYAAAIKTWKLAAHAPDTSNHPVETSVNRCLALLKEMSEAFERSSLVDVKVGTVHVNDVIDALKVSPFPTKIIQAERLLQNLEEGVYGVDTKADTNSYRIMLEVLQSNDSIKNLETAVKIIKQFENKWLVQNVNDNPNGTVDTEEVTEVFNTFLKLLATMKISKKNKTNMDAELLKHALTIAEMLRLHTTLNPNSSTYDALLRCCKHLFPQDSSTYRSAMKRIFETCCSEGLVDGTVLTTFRECATTELFHQLVVSQHVVVEDVPVVPESWTRNVLGGRIKADDGRTTTPLDLHGRPIITRSMYHFRMRRVREQRTRRLLEGGRLRQRPVYADPFQQR